MTDPDNRDVKARHMYADVKARLFGERAGSVKIGRFAIERLLGEGGMGVVYAAKDAQLGRRVAIKVLLGDADVGSQGRARLMREAQALAKLSHPNVVPVFEVGEHEGDVFVAMEFVEGQTLREWLDADTSRSWREIVEAFVQAGEGLAAAHDAELVHRDFKPENAIVGGDRRVRVLDFGLARAIIPGPTERLPALSEAPDDGGVDEPLTRTGAVMGTPAYMSPEQHLGQATDARTDQFSFCVALWEALYGSRPFAGGTRRELVLAVTSGRRASPGASRVPVKVRRVLDRGLELRASRRYGDMHELLAELQRAARPRAVVRNLSIVAGLGASAAAVAVGMSDAPADCGDFEARVEQVWGDEARSGVRDAYERSGLPDAEALLAGFIGQLDAYADTWRQTYEQACDPPDGLPDELPALQRVCLDVRLAAFDAYIQMVPEISGPSLRRQNNDNFIVKPSERCLIEQVARSQVRLPDDPTQRQQVLDIRRDLELGLELMDVEGQFDRAIELTMERAAQAQAIDYPALKAFAKWYVGWAKFRVAVQDCHERRCERKEDDGVAEIEQAIRDMEAARYDEPVPHLWGDLLQIRARYGDLERAHEAAERAEAAFARIGDDPERHGWVTSRNASVYEEEGDLEAAEREYRKVLALGEGTAREAVPLRSLSWIALQRGELAEAGRLADEAHAINRERNNDPTYVVWDRGQTELFHANLARDRGDLDQACSRARAARTSVESFPAELFNDAEIQALAILAGCAARAGDTAEMDRLLAAAEEYGERHLGDEPFPPAVHAVAVAYAEAGRFAEALERFRGMEGAMRSLPVPADRALQLAPWGIAEARGGDAERAVTILEEVTKTLAACCTKNPGLARAELGLAQALARDEAQRARALELAASARARFDALGTAEGERGRKEVDAWSRDADPRH